MKNLKSYLIIFTMILIPVSGLFAEEKVIPICTNAENVFLFSSVKSSKYGNDDGTLICWLEQINDGSLWIQKIDTDGNTQWAANGILADTDLGNGFTEDADYPVMFSDNKGGAVIIYRKMFFDREDIYFGKITGEGHSLMNPVLISSFYRGYNYSPDAALTTDNNIVISWENFHEGEFDIHAQMLDMEGNKLWNDGSEIKVCGVDYDQRKPTVACNQYNDIIISWLDARGRTEYSFDLYANIFNAKGEANSYPSKGKLIFKNTRPVTPRKEVFFNHNVISSSKNSFIFALENSFDNQYSNINAVKVNNNLDREWILDLQSGSHQSDPLIVSNGNYGAGVIWKDNMAGKSEIRGIVIGEDGTILWGTKTGKNLICSSRDPEQEMLISSERNRNGFFINQNKIYAGLVTKGINKLFLTGIDLADESVQCDNTLEIQDYISEGEYTSITFHGNNVSVVFKQSGSIFATIRNLSEKGFMQEIKKPEIRNFPNPFNPSTKISFSIPSDGFVRLSVFDITGRLIKTLVNEYKTAGNHTVIFDGSNLSSGVYFYRLEANGAAHTNRMTMLK